MRVAIIGGNFLGCATSFYIRKGLSDHVEITIFEKSERLGGEKFRTVGINTDSDNDVVEVMIGRMAGIDVTSCAFFQQLLKEAQVKLGYTNNRTMTTFGVFDWDKDEYVVWNSPFGWRFWIQAMLAIGMIWILGKWSLGWTLRGMRTSAWVGLGVIGVLCALFLWFGGRRMMVSLQAHMAFTGAPSMSSVIDRSIIEHLERVLKSECATSSGISLAHFLSRCGLLKYVKESAFEKYVGYGITSKFLNDVVEQVMKVSVNASAGSSHSCNALAAFFAVAQASFIPMRRNPHYLDSNDAKVLCQSIAKAARAQIRLNSEVIGIKSSGSFDSYDLKLRMSHGSLVTAKDFDAVIICCVPDHSGLSFDASEEFRSNIAQSSSRKYSEKNANDDYSKSPARYVNVVYGALNPEYFGTVTEDSVPEHVSIVNSAKFHSVTRIRKLGSNQYVYRVYSRNMLSEDSKDIGLLFTKVHGVKSVATRRAPYCVSPMRSGDNSEDVPGIILEKRCLYAGAVKRVGGGIELDCMFGLNIASLLMDKTQWK